MDTESVSKTYEEWYKMEADSKKESGKSIQSARLDDDDDDDDDDYINITYIAYLMKYTFYALLVQSDECFTLQCGKQS